MELLKLQFDAILRIFEPKIIKTLRKPNFQKLSCSSKEESVIVRFRNANFLHHSVITSILAEL